MAKTAELQKTSEPKSVVVWKDYSRNILAAVKPVRSIGQALMAAKSHQVPTIRKMVAEAGEDMTTALLCKILIDLSDYLQLKTPMSENHILFIVETILVEYKMLTVADVEVVIKRIKSGYYGELYERLDSSKFLNFIKKYWDERVEYSMNQEDIDAERLKLDAMVVNERFGTKYQELAKKEVLM